MKKSELFTLLDKEKMMQTGVFDHDTEEYKKIYEYLKELKDNDNAEELSENKQKAEVTPNKPLYRNRYWWILPGLKSSNRCIKQRLF